MADQSDVETVLVTLVAAALYPKGTAQASAPGPDCRIYRGWPNSATLDTDLSAGRINVTVFPLSDPTHITTRHMGQWFGKPPIPTLIADVEGITLALGGSADPGQVAGVLADRKTYVYRTQAGDTPALVAASLAAQARADWLVTLAGNRVILHGATRIVARVAADGSVSKEVRRQHQGFRITCWCPTPASRDITAVAIDQALARLTFLDMPDSSSARITYGGTAVFDQSQDALLYRRDLIYQVEYPTLMTNSAPSMLFGDLLINATESFA